MSPQYSYRCPECMGTYTAPRTVGLRDAPLQCARCLFNDKESWCERIVESPAFSIKGFSEKNGYSR